jgi:hypothetical protein
MLAGFQSPANREVLGTVSLREGHVIEIYWATGLQPIPDLYAEPIDLEVPEEQMRREVDRLAAHFGVQPSA